MAFKLKDTGLQPSAIRALFDRARQMPGAIDLSIGQADFDVPEPIKEATIAAIRRGCGGYGSTEGLAELVEATRRSLAVRAGLAPSESVIMTSGATGAIVLALMATVGAGDQVLLPDPYFVAYRRMVELSGAEPAHFRLGDGFRLSAEAIARAIGPRTRVLMINSPGNPTGATWSQEDLGAVAKLCRDRGILIISDELYEQFSYDRPHTSIKRFPDTDSVLIGGFSKAYGMAGWRLGWAAGPPEILDRMRTLQQFVYTCPPTLVQHGALAAFGVDMSDTVTRYKQKRDRVYQRLCDAGYQVVKPSGGFFFFPRTPRGDDLVFCERALAEKLIIVPGRHFSTRTDHFRMTFAASEELLERGLDVLARLAA